MALMSVVDGGSRDLDEVARKIEAIDKANRYRVRACRSSSSRWNDLAMYGFFEIDAVGADHFPILAPERQALLREIAPFSMGQDGPTWIVTYHSLTRIGAQLGIGEVHDEFARTWPVPGQVHLKRFELDRDVNANIDRLVGYSMKSRCEINIPNQMPNGRWDKVRVPWPVSWQANYYTWLHQRRNGFEFLRFTISPVIRNHLKVIDHNNIDNTLLCYYDDYVGSEIEPMPILF